MGVNKTFFDDIGIIRAFCIISIVIGHSFAIYSNSSYWVLPMNVEDIEFYKWINPAVINIELQTFVFISGFLFGYQGKKSNTFSFLIKKIKRIIIPCILFGIIYYITIDRYKLDKVSISYFLSGAGHLWFLPMIFCCYFISNFFWNWMNKPNITIFLLLSSLSIFSIYIPQLICIQNLATYLIYFVLGIWCYNYKEQLLTLLKKRKSGIYLLSLVVLFTIAKCYIYYNRSFQGADIMLHFVKYLLGIVGSITCLYIANLNIIHKVIPTKISRWNGWYGIYIYHQFILMYFYYNIPISLINNYLIPVFAFIISTIISIILVELTLKTKVGKWLIG